MTHDKPTADTQIIKLVEAGWEADRRGQRIEARNMWETALRLAREAGDLASESEALSGLGVSVRYDFDFTRSEALLREALERAEAGGHKREAVRARANLAITLRQMGRLDMAQDESQIAARLYRDIGELAGVNRMLHLQSQILQDQGLLEQALKLMEEVIELDEITGDRSGQARSLGLMSSLLHEMGRYDEAISRLQQVITIFKALGEPSFLALGLINLAEVHKSAGRLDDAMESLDEALRVTAPLHMPGRQARALSLRAAVLVMLERPDEAADAVLKANDLVGSNADGYMRQANAVTLARIALRRHNPRQALEHAELAVQTSREEGYPVLLVDSLWLKAGALLQLGETDDAREAVMEAIEVLDRTDKPEQQYRLKCTALHARIEQQAGNAEDARFLAEEAEDLRAKLNVTESSHDPELREVALQLRELATG